MHTIKKMIDSSLYKVVYDTNQHYRVVDGRLTKEEAKRLANYLNGGNGYGYLSDRLPSIPCPIEDAANWQQQVQEASGMDSEQRKTKAVELIMEEYHEWEEACIPQGHTNPHSERHEAKEIYDLIFVLIGRLLALGYNPHLVMEDGNASNWTKLQSDEPLENSYNEKQEAKMVGEKWGVFQDGKLQKGPWYEKPTFEGCKTIG